MSTVIKVENLSKQYRLGLIGSGTLRDDLEGWWYRIRGKEDPTLMLGDVNDRTTVGESNYVWALRDINFEVQQGEVLGIIGKNGAGKSTLLKLLSRVTAPTTGHIKAKGRIASLLEVGTGFHPELTGKENIFLNGAIMGMKKQEINRKLDEIIDFAGVERYLGTPVKRYSSGMYVRLAFAVAAHLEPEILIVDEVLAVGDAEFQKKALGKMKEVSSGGGRTVLFVSHNMASVESLCSRAILLQNGGIVDHGEVKDVVAAYLSRTSKLAEVKLSDVSDRKGNGRIRFTDGWVSNNIQTGSYAIRSLNETFIVLKFISLDITTNSKVRVDIGVNTLRGERVTWLSTEHTQKKPDLQKDELIFRISKLSLSPGTYNLNIYCEIDGEIADYLIEVMEFKIASLDYYQSGKSLPSGFGHFLLEYDLIS